MNRLRPLALFVALPGIACTEPSLQVGDLSQGASEASASDDSGTTATSESTTNDPTTDAPTTDVPTTDAPTTTEGGTLETSTADESSSDGGSSEDGGIDDTTGGGEVSACEWVDGFQGLDPEAITCNLWTQDCGPGEKCVAWLTGLNGGAFDATICVDVFEPSNAFGESCNSFGDGSDDCEFGTICTASVTGEGNVCTAQCTGSEGDPVCPEGQACSIANGGVVAWCLPLCDPFAADACPVGQGCWPVNDLFSCFIDNSNGEDQGAYGSPCLGVNECDPGLTCMHGGLVPGCAGDACCAPLCDLDAPACPDVDLRQTCEPWFDEGAAPPGLEGVGKCVTPCAGDL